LAEKSLPQSKQCWDLAKNGRGKPSIKYEIANARREYFGLETSLEPHIGQEGCCLLINKEVG
jgi:hypothetical protein